MNKKILISLIIGGCLCFGAVETPNISDTINKISHQLDRIELVINNGSVAPIIDSNQSRDIVEQIQVIYVPVLNEKESVILEKLGKPNYNANINGVINYGWQKKFGKLDHRLTIVVKDKKVVKVSSQIETLIK